MQFESIPFTQELLNILKEIPKEQWNLLSIPELVKQVKYNLEAPVVIQGEVPPVLEINVADQQPTYEKLS